MSSVTESVLCTPEAKTPGRGTLQQTGIKKSLLTPCRRIGLAKKSPGACNLASIERKVNRENVEDKLTNKQEVIPDSKCENKSSVLYTPYNKRYKSVSRTIVESDKSGECKSSHSTYDREVHGGKIGPSNVMEFKGIDSETGGRTGDVHLQSSAKKLGSRTCIQGPSFPGSDERCVVSLENVTEEALVRLRLMVKQKESDVEELKLAQLYKRKHDLKRLSALTERWRAGCQEALQELHEVSEAQGCKLSIQQLLEKLGIPHDLVRYDDNLEDFV